MPLSPRLTTAAGRRAAAGLLALAAASAPLAQQAAPAAPAPSWEGGKPHCWANAPATQAWLAAGWRAWRTGETWRVEPAAGGARWQALASTGQAADGATAPSCMLDRGTGLAWAVGRISDDVGLQGDAPGSAAARTSATNQARFCGHDDWRLPTRAELLTLMHFAPSASRRLMPGLGADGRYFWSATAYPAAVTGLGVTADWHQSGQAIPVETAQAHFVLSPAHGWVDKRRLTERASLLLVRDAACHVGARRYWR